MKWLICSDSHGNHSLMAKAVELEKPDRILHLGDVTRDARRLQEAFPELEIVGVRGNCDPSDGETPEERELFFGLRRVWMLHGHTYWVKSGLGMLTAEARTRGVEVVVFGHTHQPVCYLEGSLWVLNPGAIGGAAALATYGVIEERDGKVYCRTGVV